MKMLLKVLFIATSLIIGSVTCFASGQLTRVRKDARIRLNANKPTVYLSYKQLIKGKARISDGSEDKLLLELNNNTRWKVYYFVLPERAEPGAVAMIYKVEDDQKKLGLEPDIGDIIITKVLEPGESVSFAVARKHLAKGFRIYVEINYEWETRGSSLTHATEPNHRVYFSHYNLPKGMRD